MPIIDIVTPQKARVYVLALGGTIACTSNNGMNEYYSSPSLGIENLISQLPINKNKIEIRHEQISQQISHEMTHDELIHFSKKINELVNSAEVAGVVVVQGTNCIEETAYFINLTIKTQKPIIFTGSFRPSNALGFDGTRNLFNAITMACDQKLQGLGVLLTFNDCIASARDAAKLNPLIMDNFSGNEFGLLGYTQVNGLSIERVNKYRHTYRSEFNIVSIDKLPEVCILYGHLGMSNMLVNAAIANNVAGIISAGMGKGYQPKCVTEALVTANRKGIFVVRSSRTGQGHINRESNHDDKYDFIAGGSLSPQKARILLSVALTNTNDKTEIQRIFTEY